MSLRYFLIILLACGLFASSCNKDDNRASAPIQTGPGAASAYVNGQYLSLPNGSAQLIPTANMQITCSGAYGNLNITISPFNGISTYMLDGFTKITYTESGVQYSSIRGQIQVTNNTSNYIEGNFNGELISTTGSTSLTFTDGQFSVPKY